MRGFPLPKTTNALQELSTKKLDENNPFCRKNKLCLAIHWLLFGSFGVFRVYVKLPINVIGWLILTRNFFAFQLHLEEFGPKLAEISHYGV